MTNRMYASIQYQLRDYRTAGLILFGVNLILILWAIVGMFSIDINGQVSYTAYGFSAAVFMLVSGIVTARQVIRLCAQMGTGRKTAFLSLIPPAIIASLVIAAAGELLIVGAQVVTSGHPELYFSDLYGIMYVGFDDALTAGQHVISVLFSTCLMLACYGFGLFCSFLYWRLSKIGCVIGGILMGVFFLVGLPEIFLHFEAQIMTLMEFCLKSGWNFMALFLLTGAVFTLISWLLVRNVNIRGGAK